MDQRRDLKMSSRTLKFAGFAATALMLMPSFAQAKVYSFDYSGGPSNGLFSVAAEITTENTFDTTTNGYDITGIAGTVRVKTTSGVSVETISGLVPIQRPPLPFDNGVYIYDNVFFLSEPHFDNAGLLFTAQSDAITYTYNLYTVGADYLLSSNNPIGNFNPGVAANSFVASVPEPSTWAMMLLGFGGLGITARRRKRHGHIVASTAVWPTYVDWIFRDTAKLSEAVASSPRPKTRETL